jgi:hypothetical protein
LVFFLHKHSLYRVEVVTNTDSLYKISDQIEHVLLVEHFKKHPEVFKNIASKGDVFFLILSFIFEGVVVSQVQLSEENVEHGLYRHDPPC